MDSAIKESKIMYKYQLVAHLFIPQKEDYHEYIIRVRNIIKGIKDVKLNYLTEKLETIKISCKMKSKEAHDKLLGRMRRFRYECIYTLDNKDQEIVWLE